MPSCVSVSLAVDLGQGGGIIHVQDVACTGGESNLLECVERRSGSGMDSAADRACQMPAGAICERELFSFFLYVINYHVIISHTFADPYYVMLSVLTC